MKYYGPYTPIVVPVMKNLLNLPVQHKDELIRFTRITDTVTSGNRYPMMNLVQ